MVLHNLRDRGNTIIVIEHNLDVIKACDWIVDLGPNGGDGGGQIVETGTPESIANSKASITGQYLKKHLSSTGATDSRRASTKKKASKKTIRAKKIRVKKS